MKNDSGPFKNLNLYMPGIRLGWLVVFSLWQLPIGLFADGEAPVIHLKGQTVTRTFKADGTTVQEEPKDFLIWVSGCRWAVHLIANTNLPGAVSQVSCDGTNIYVLIPDASGQTVVQGKTAPFRQVGEIFPGTLKVFQFRMGPLWWAFCSSCVISNQSGSYAVPDFLNISGGGLDGRVGIQVHAGRADFSPHSRVSQIGPADQSIFLSTNVAGRAFEAATLRQLDLLETNGVVVVTRCLFTSYHPSVLGEAKAFQEIMVTITGSEVKTNSFQFIPQISSSCLIRDHRQPYAGEYLSSDWLGAEERKLVFRNPELRENLLSSSSYSKAVTRVILLVLVGIPAALYASKRLRKPRVNQTTTK